MALTLVRCKAGPFQGIDASRPVVIEFPKIQKGKKGRPITLINGDQAVGKTSFLHYLLYVTKQNFGVKVSDMVNLPADALSGEFEFKQNDETWKVVITKTTFKLFRYFEVDKENKGWIPQGSEDTNLKKLIGNVAISPMKLKVDDGKKQVDWLFKMLNVPPAVIEQAKKLSGRIEEIGKTRAASRKDYEFLKKDLGEDPLFINWEDSEIKFAEIKTIEILQKKFENVTARRNLLNEGKEKLLRLEKQMEEKKAEIKKMLEELRDLRLRKIKGDKYIQENEPVEKEYQDVQQEFITISKYLAEQGAWKMVQEKKKEMDEFETLIQRANTSEANLKKQKRTLLKDMLPDIPGLEIHTEDSIDGTKTGIYLDGKNPVQLSESELFDLYFKLCRAQDVTMVVIENITDFGTDVIKTLNEMAKAGVYVWATQMERGRKELTIEFVDQLK